MKCLHKRFVIAELLCLCLLAALLGCDGPTGQRPVAKVNGQAISLAQFKARAAFMGLGADPSSLTPELRRQVAETMVRNHLVLQRATELGIKLMDEELEREENALRRGLEGPAFDQALITQGTDYAAWRGVLRQELLMRKTLDLVLASQVQVGLTEVSEYYASHPKRYQRAEQVLAQHTVLPNRELAQALLDRVAAGEDLGQASAGLGAPMAEGGEPIWLSRGHMPPELEKEIFALKSGKVSGPLASAYGWHVVRVLDKRAASQASLQEAAGEIQRRLAADKMERLAASWVDAIHSDAQVSIDADFVQNGRF